MFHPNSSTDTKLAVLEERLASYELMMKKIDEAIQIMGQTNQNISKMLAVHEEKLEQSAKTDETVAQMLKEFKEENNKQHKSVSERIDKIETEVKDIAKIKWMTVGCGTLLAILTMAVATLAAGWWNPFETHYKQIGPTVPETQMRR